MAVWQECLGHVNEILLASSTMSIRGVRKLGSWVRLRRKYLKRIYLVDLMSKIESELLFLLTTKQLLGYLSDCDKQRIKSLAKWFKWLKRIYQGMWPWRLI